MEQRRRGRAVRGLVPTIVTVAVLAGGAVGGRAGTGAGALVAAGVGALVVALLLGVLVVGAVALVAAGDGDWGHRRRGPVPDLAGEWADVEPRWSGRR